MRKQALTLSAAALAMVGIAGAATAHNHRDGHHSPDANGDGIVTKAEANAAAAAMWQKMDANNDGVLTQADREAMKEKRAERREQRGPERFAALDADGNGEVSLAEMQAHHAERMAERTERRGTDAKARPDRAERHAQMFARLDTDKSGGLSQAELEAGREMRKERMAERGGKRGQRDGMHGGRMMGKMADANGDGTITRAEFDAARAKHFAMVDTDGNGQLSKAEQEAARAAMKAKWQERRAAKPAS